MGSQITQALVEFIVQDGRLLTTTIDALINPAAASDTYRELVNYLVMRAIYTDNLYKIQEYTVLRRFADVADTETIVALWEYILSPRRKIAVGTMCDVMYIIINAETTPQDIIDELFDSLIGDICDCRVRHDKPRLTYELMSRGFVDMDYYNPTEAALYNVVDIIQSSDQAPRYISALLSAGDRIDDYIRLMKKWLGYYRSWDQDSSFKVTIYILWILDAMLLSRCLTTEQWRRIFGLVIGLYSTHERNSALFDVMDHLVYSPCADADGLRSLWRYTWLRAEILRHPKIGKGQVHETVDKLLAGKIDAMLREPYVNAIAHNPSISSEELAPLLLLNDHQTQETVREAIQKRRCQPVKDGKEM